MAQDQLQSMAVGPTANFQQRETMLQNFVDNLDDADRILPVTPAQATKSQPLHDLEQNLAAANPQMQQRLQDITKAQQQTINKELGTPQDIRAAQKNIKADTNVRIARLQETSDQGIQNADNALLAYAGKTEGDIGTQLTGELKAYQQTARENLNKIWSQLPNEMFIDTKNFVETVKTLNETGNINAIKQAWQAYQPNFAVKHGQDLTPIIDRIMVAPEPIMESVGELHAISSRLKHITRESLKGNPPLDDRQRAGIARTLSNAIDQDILASQAGKAYQTGLDATRKYWKPMGATNVEKLTSKTSQGATVIDPKSAAEATLGKGTPTQRLTAAEQLSNVGVSKDTIQTFFLKQFADQGISLDGSINPNQLKTWIRQNNSLLKTYPQLRKTVAQVTRKKINAEKLAQNISQRIKKIETGPSAKFCLYQH